MTGPSNSDRIFPVFNRGELREDLLDDFRLGLAGIINPDTQVPFTAAEIAAATAQGGDRWKEADALDLVLLADQQRGLWMSDQGIPTRAGSSFLQTLWGPLWLPDGYLQASGGSGPVATTAVPGTVWHGSTTVPDPAGAAVYGTDSAGLRYQVLFDATTDAAGNVTLLVQGIDTGLNTDLAQDATVTWANAPVTGGPTGTVTADFTGGQPAETDAGFARRIVSTIRHRPAAGNDAQQAQWAQTSGANNAVEAGWIYACALHAGSLVVAVTQNRGTVRGPTGRIPAPGVLAQVTTRLVPPGSAVQPALPFVFVVPVVGVATDMVLSLEMPVGSPSGWEDLQPWPGQSGGTPSVVGTVADQEHFQLTSPVPLPAGVTAPAMMIWNATTSRFEELSVLSVTLVSGSTYAVVLAAPPEMTLATGAWISPFSAQIDLLGETIESYFDSLGPGEVVNLATDPRATRAFRFPPPNEEFPQIAGSAVVTFLGDALGAALALGTLQAISVTAPAVPADPSLGPNLLVAGRVGLYPN